MYKVLLKNMNLSVDFAVIGQKREEMWVSGHVAFCRQSHRFDEIHFFLIILEYQRAWLNMSLIWHH